MPLKNNLYPQNPRFLGALPFISQHQSQLQRVDLPNICEPHQRDLPDRRSHQHRKPLSLKTIQITLVQITQLEKAAHVQFILFSNKTSKNVQKPKDIQIQKRAINEPTRSREKPVVATRRIHTNRLDQIYELNKAWTA